MFAVCERDVGHSGQGIVLVIRGLAFGIRHGQGIAGCVAGDGLLADIWAGLGEHFAPSVAGELGADAFGIDGLGELVELVVIAIGLSAIGQDGGNQAA